jgi:hypothetical protein
MITQKVPQSKSVSESLARMEAELEAHKDFIAFMQLESATEQIVEVKQELEQASK